MTEFEKIHLQHTQQQNKLFTIKQQLYTLTNNSGRHWCWKLPRLLLYCDLFLRLIRCPWVLGWSSNGSISPWQANSSLQFITQCNWLMSLTMDLATLWDMWRWKWYKWMPLTVFSPPSHPVGVLVVLTMPVKNYLKWWAIYLAIHSIVTEYIDYK